MTDNPKTQIILLGAGNANLQVVRWWGMGPPPGATLTLVSESDTMPYSGMLPGCIAGQYPREQVTLDLVRLCAASNVGFVKAFALRVERTDRAIVFVDRPPMRYDVLCMNVGSRPMAPDAEHDGASSLLLKPLFSLMDRIEALDRRVRASRGPFPIVVVGGGASAFELCMTLRARYAGESRVSIEAVMAGARPLQSAAASVSRAGRRAMRERGVALRTGVRVAGADTASVELDTGERVPCATCVWATQATPPEIIDASGFDVDDRGFLCVHDTLQSVNDPAVFGTGDTISMTSHPGLPKAGVYAVREGPVLWDNLCATLEGRPPRAYVPQKRTLFLLNTGDGGAIMSYGPFTGRGRWAFAWKNRIDRKWVRQFADTYAHAGSGSERRMAAS